MLIRDVCCIKPISEHKTHSLYPSNSSSWTAKQQRVCIGTRPKIDATLSSGGNLRESSYLDVMSVPMKLNCLPIASWSSEMWCLFGNSRQMLFLILPLFDILTCFLAFSLAVIAAFNYLYSLRVPPRGHQSDILTVHDTVYTIDLLTMSQLFSRHKLIIAFVHMPLLLPITITLIQTKITEWHHQENFKLLEFSVIPSPKRNNPPTPISKFPMNSRDGMIYMSFRLT